MSQPRIHPANLFDPAVEWYDISTGRHDSYWVRTLPDNPYQGPAEPALGVDELGFALYRAHHEAAHAVLGMVAGAHVAWTSLRIDGGVTASNQQGADPWGEVLATAAGERANDRWLREQGLWTPLAAWITEVCAEGDRDGITSAHPYIGFGRGAELDYGVLHTAADQLLDAYWRQITVVALVLADRERLTGDEIASLANLANPKNPELDQPEGSR